MISRQAVIGIQRNKRWQAAALAGSVLALSAAQQLLPMERVHIHNFLQHLYFLPLVVAGLTFGWQGALWAGLGVAAAQTPHILRSWGPQHVNAIDQLLELPVFLLAGLVAGLLTEKEKQQRGRLEMTKRQLEEVYEELQQNVERLKKAERLSAAGQLAAGLAHEIRNPLASISGAAGILARGNAPPENVEACLEIIDKESQRLNRLLTSFLEFARPRPPRFQRLEPAALLDSVVALAMHNDGASGVRLSREIQAPLPELDGDPEQLKQVLLNLVINAMQASPEGGRVRLLAESAGGRLGISVCDEGPGAPPEVLEHIFEPFFTTKKKGTGLGLAVAAGIVHQHGGSLTASNNPRGGMTFRMELPLDHGART
jgi:signal transduction histidine kinase